MMKNDLTCGVVRDLLPSYVENLLGEESREAVERHLEGCPDCTAKKEAMTAPTGAEETAEAAKEVDFLMKVKKRSAKRVVLAVVCTAAVLLLALVLKVFIIGTPLQEQSVEVLNIDPAKGCYKVTIESNASADAYHSWKVEVEDGIACIYARRVLVSPLFPEGSAVVPVPRDIKEIWLGGRSGRLIFQDGREISRKALELYEARTPYMGDAPALGNLLEVLDLSCRSGEYTMALQTSSRPYRLTLNYTGSRDPSPDVYVTLLLALVENLEEVEWTWTDENGTFHSRVITAEDTGAGQTASAFIEENWDVVNVENIKTYGETPGGIQFLIKIMGIQYLFSSGA